MSFLGKLFGGGSQQTGVHTSVSEPPAYALPYLEHSLTGARDIYETPGQYYPNQTYVDFSPTTSSALGAGEARATAGNPLLGNAQGFTQAAMGGGFVNPAAAMLNQTARGDFLQNNNPYFAAAMQPAIDRVQGQFSRSGRLGSGANMSAMTSALAPMYAQDYNRERQNQIAAQGQIGSLAQQDFANRMGAARMAPVLAQADYADIDRLSTYGQIRDQKSAEALSDDIARWNFTQNEPTQRLQNYLAAVRGGTFGGSETRPIYSNPVGEGISNVANLGAAAKFFSDAWGSW